MTGPIRLEGPWTNMGPGHVTRRQGNDDKSEILKDRERMLAS